MKIIKFRFWNEDKKEMDTIQGDLNPLGELETNDVPMQFTGLMDKNGKCIFDGDIVKLYSEGAPSEVSWLDAYGWVSEGDCSWFRQTSGSGRSLALAIAAYDENVEVIGNIYENPELL